ncbi:MAG: hypothetical protein QOE13_1439 [Gaiellaceae bacterium]|jgi:hypothetical protein|nr:hypothetical protein [Gaiellaceae bacterium]
MTNARPNRPIPLALTMLIAVFSALVALALSGGHHMDMTAHAATAQQQHLTSHRELALRQGMRRLWEEHVMWTRLAVISLTTSTPDTAATVTRLLKNQTDIGNAIKPYYGAAAGRQLTALLREHILIAADLIAAALKGDTSAVNDQQTRWTSNVDRIATLLNHANPRFWKLAPTRAMLHDHLRLTTDEVVARLQHSWAADVKAYDEIHRQALHMADMLSTGIIGQFANRFSASR